MSSTINDGDESTCYPMQPAGVSFTWRDPISFTWMRLQFKNAVSPAAIDVKIYQNTDHVCAHPSKAVITNKTVDVYCAMAAKKVTHLNITSAEGSQLCSVYVSRGRNIALKQNTSQAGTYRNKDIPASISKSKNAVDGDRNANFSAGSCTHTRTTETANWTLNFALPHYADTYVLYNRQDLNQDRLRKFQLVSYDITSNPLFTYHDNDSLQPVYRVRDYEIGDNISSVTITANNGEKILTLCEVEIYGDVICSPGYYGPGCNLTCNCENKSEKCLVSTGVCLSGCPAGYIGEGCKTRCDDGFYGKNCLNKCSEHCSNVACNVNSGACSCKAGYQGDKCVQACDAGFYGTNCSTPCSQHCINHECNNTNGYCSCKVGYIGDLCTQDTKCTDNWFGPRCQYKCHCKTSGCGADGQCHDGCGSGWFGPQCQYLDIAKNATTMNTTIKDGDDNTCYPMQPAGVSLTWNDPISFTWMRLQFKNAVPHAAIDVKLYKSSDQVCAIPIKAVITNKTVDVYCEMAAKNVTHLNITSADGSQLCSVYVSGGRNIALKQNTTQAGTYSDRTISTSISKSENAVDGNTNSDFSRGSCTHTSTLETGNWTLTFSLPHYADTYVLYNRQGFSQYRLSQFQLVSFDINSSPLFTYHDKNTIQRVYRVRDYEIGDNISSVTITANNVEKTLTLCEVEIYGAGK